MHDSTNGNGQAFRLKLEMDPGTGQLLKALADNHRCLLNFNPGPELRVNGLPLHTRLVEVDYAVSEHITRMHANLPAAYGAGALLEIRRVLTLGGGGLHSGRSQSLHVRYEIRRLPNTVPGNPLDYIWQPEIEAPLRVDTIDVLCAPTPHLGPETRLRSVVIGGSGPREHVSLEDAPIREVIPYIQSGFRSTFPGQPSINGGLFYSPDDHRYLWAMVRRPTVGGRIAFDVDRMGFAFHFFQDMPLHHEIMTPAVSFHWGRGLGDADQVLADQFDQYEEPPDWWYRTCWFWLHPNWQKDGSFDAMRQGAEILHRQCGVNGFGIFCHDQPASGNDCDLVSPQPNPLLGGDRAFRDAMSWFNDRGIHTYVWMSQKGHRPDGPGFRDSWAIQGVDGRTIRLRNRPDAGVRLDIVNPSDPSFYQYMCEWIEYYVRELGVTGIFWDSGFQPIPPDFGTKPYLRSPGHSMAGMLEFYRKIYRFGRSLSPDFFMWAEGLNVDVPMNAFAVDKCDLGLTCGHAMMHRLAHLGSRRLVWRSAWSQDVAGAFPFISPVSDVGWPAGSERYARAAADPMNQWLCRTVKERGVRQARGLGRGISQLDEFIIVSPGAPAQEIEIGSGRASEVRLEPIVAGAAVAPGSRVRLEAPGAYRLQASTGAPHRTTAGALS